MPTPLALLVLAWALVRTLFARMLGRPTGLPAFRASYAADRVPPATPEERGLLPPMSGCVACGLCDVGGPGPMDLALASSRSTPDADAAVLSLASLPDPILALRERTCPTGVPLVAIARLTRARAAAIVVEVTRH